MKKYDVTLTGHYEKTISVYADSPEQAKEKMETVLFDTDLIHFTDNDFVCGEAVITDDNEGNHEEIEVQSDDDAEDECSGCPYLCPMCGCCMCEDGD